MKQIKQHIAVVLVMALGTAVNAQTHMVHGRLTAFNTYPVQNVPITSKKGKATTLSDSMGRFSIMCLENDVVKIRPKTFKSVSKRIGPDTDSLLINLIFIDTRKNRDVAVGYGYVDENDLVYAVNNLQQENNEFCNYKDVFDILQSRFVGVKVDNGSVIIRGQDAILSNAEALYVVDGVIVNSIEWVIPCQIKSINILKDASAAVYGARGSNGVVIIVTQ